MYRTKLSITFIHVLRFICTLAHSDLVFDSSLLRLALRKRVQAQRPHFLTAFHTDLLPASLYPNLLSAV